MPELADARRHHHAKQRRLLAAGALVAVLVLTACRGDEKPPPTTMSPPTTTTTTPTSAPPAGIDAAALAGILATRDAEQLASLTPLVAPGSPASKYLAHQIAARALLGPTEPAVARTNGAEAEICETATDCVTIEALEIETATGLLRSFAIGGASVDGRATGNGPIATVEDVALSVASAARSTDATLTVVLRVENGSSVSVEWFGFAATYIDPLGSVVEATGTWGGPAAEAGAATEILIAFPSEQLGGVIELSGLRGDGIDLSVTVVVPDSR